MPEEKMVKVLEYSGFDSKEEALEWMKETQEDFDRLFKKFRRAMYFPLRHWYPMCFPVIVVALPEKKE